MKHLPLFFDLKDRKVVVVGEGPAADRRAAQVIDPDVRKLAYKGAGRARQGGATVGRGPLAHHHDPAA